MFMQSSSTTWVLVSGFIMLPATYESRRGPGDGSWELQLPQLPSIGGDAADTEAALQDGVHIDVHWIAFYRLAALGRYGGSVLDTWGPRVLRLSIWWPRDVGRSCNSPSTPNRICRPRTFPSRTPDSTMASTTSTGVSSQSTIAENVITSMNRALGELRVRLFVLHRMIGNVSRAHVDAIHLHVRTHLAL